MVPEIPDEGVCRDRDERPCRVRYHHHRERLTGPCFALVVAQCTTHECAFTLYPPGHVPYGRRAVAPVAPDGSAVRPAQCEQGADGVGPPRQTADGFKGTVFDAALDAVRGIVWKERWQRACSDRAKDCGRTQRRRIDVAVQMLAVASTIAVTVREQVAEVLSVPLLLLADLAHGLVAASRYRDKAKAVVQVLAALPHGASLAGRLVEAGHLAGLWPSAVRWDPQRRILLRSAFRPAGTRGPPLRD